MENVLYGSGQKWNFGHRFFNMLRTQKASLHILTFIQTFYTGGYQYLVVNIQIYLYILGYIVF